MAEVDLMKLYTAEKLVADLDPPPELLADLTVEPNSITERVIHPESLINLRTRT